MTTTRMHRLLTLSACLLLLPLAARAQLRTCADPAESKRCGSEEKCVDRKELGGFTQCVATIDAGLSAVDCAHAGSVGCFYEWIGPISRQRIDAFDRFLESKTPASARTGFGFTISSDGGDVDAAMTLGSRLRKKRALVEVPPGGRCASACVFVLAGGVHRAIHGPVIIHRPFRAAARVRGREQAQADFEARNARMSAYLKSMNVSTALLDAMLAIPSEDSRALSASELVTFRLSGTDAVFQEEQDAAAAAKLGISMPEYLRRKSRYNQCREAHGGSAASIRTCQAEMSGQPSH